MRYEIQVHDSCAWVMFWKSLKLNFSKNTVLFILHDTFYDQFEKRSALNHWLSIISEQFQSKKQFFLQIVILWIICSCRLGVIFSVEKLFSIFGLHFEIFISR